MAAIPPFRCPACLGSHFCTTDTSLQPEHQVACKDEHDTGCAWRGTMREATLASIARKHLHLGTLETRANHDLDFSNQAVWSIKEALDAAYAAGQVDGSMVPVRPGRYGR